jgi:coenzyme PQQ precursor peptide PqqA
VQVQVTTRRGRRSKVAESHDHLRFAFAIRVLRGGLDRVCHCNRLNQGRAQLLKESSLARSRGRLYRLSWCGKSAVPFERRSGMAWKTPKIVEVPVGMEINMYACAARK